MSIRYVKNIKYKGFHPFDKKSTIKVINLMIKKFNELNDVLINYYVENGLLSGVENTIQTMFPGHRNYLLRYIKFSVASITKNNEKLRELREKEFQTLVNDLVNNSKQTLKQKNIKISGWHTFNEKNFNTEVQNINEMVKYQIDKLIARVSVLITKRQDDKIKELIKKSSDWIKDLENNLKEPNGLYLSDPKQRNNAEKMLTALQNLTDVLEKRSGKFSLTTIQPLKRCFGQNRNWKSTEKNLISIEEIPYSPIKNSDRMTNLVVLCLLGIVTDVGTKPLELIKNYIENTKP